ncbi:MAG: shikimate kinase II [Myxococcales bacterium FL481]|nr:MAG: shikimate kinase II [Myxococcales bacterium FL481]
MTQPSIRGAVFLTGMMGAGKSTVGRELARLRGAVFVDLDVRIERIAGRLIAEVFAADGEAGFRRLEHAALRSLLAEPGYVDVDSVVATGGGVVVDRRNRELMRSAGRVVHLVVPLDELLRRLQAPAQLAARPLLAARSLRESVAARLAQREPLYKTAELCIDASEEPHLVAARILEELSCARTHSPKELA